MTTPTKLVSLSHLILRNSNGELYILLDGAACSKTLPKLTAPGMLQTLYPNQGTSVSY